MLVPGGTKKLRTMSFSLKGSQPWTQGFDTSAQILTNGEPIGLHKESQLQVIIDNITSIKHGNIYCEEPKLSWMFFLFWKLRDAFLKSAESIKILLASTCNIVKILRLCYSMPRNAYGSWAFCKELLLCCLMISGLYLMFSDVFSMSLDLRDQEYSQRVAAALDFNAKLRASLRSVELKTSFHTSNKDLTKQLREVARLIATSASA